jgi:opacity protein-like surface antigen
MKKALIIALSICAMSAFADIGVYWLHTGYTGDENGDFDTGNWLTQLLWSPTAPSGVASVGGGLVTGEILLDSLNTSWGNFDSGAGVEYENSLFGANLNSGYLFSRVWNVEGTYYYQSSSIAPTHPEYSATDGSTLITADLLTGTTNTTGIQAVPEPATVGLFGLGALSAWIVRRNKMQAREEV